MEPESMMDMATIETMIHCLFENRLHSLRAGIDFLVIMAMLSR
jgi:hypothetical protein